MERLGRAPDDASLIMRDARHVLNQDVPRSHYFGEASHPEIESVTRVGPPRVIVQVAVALAWGPAHDDVEPGELCRQPPLVSGGSRAELAVDQVFNAAGIELRFGEVVTEDT